MALDPNSPRSLVVGTHNRKKGEELADLLRPLGFDVATLADFPNAIEVVEDGDSFGANAGLKATQQAIHLGRWVLADDSGLVVDALGGRPGIYSARFAGPGATDEANNELLLRELTGVPFERRTARFVCCLVCAAPSASGIQRIATAQAAVEGHIGPSARGEGGFGYDPLFLPVDFPLETTASLSGADKDRISHRGQAARRILGPLAAWLARQTPP